MIDGCTPGQAFRKVILPLAAPGRVHHGDHRVHRRVERVHHRADDGEQGRVPHGRGGDHPQFTGATGFDTPFGTIMAAGVIVTIPLVIMVLIFQRRIVAGLTAGGVKS